MTATNPRVVCAPDSFKETIDAARAAGAMSAGVLAARPAWDVDPCPIADGGEGSLAVHADATGAGIRRELVTGPLGEPVEARYGVAADGTTAIIELAEASGLVLVPPDRRDPTRTTSFGTGELIRKAAGSGCSRAIVFLGGSATCDGGAGIAQALGARFLDAAGRPIEAPLTGGSLHLVDRVVPPPRSGIALVAAFDVANPLTGPRGAAAVYGPQKGATPGQVDALDRALANLAARAGGDPLAPGAGAAGGAGYGLAAMCAATLRRGIDVILEAIRFAERCRGATLVLTGEGCLEGQSLEGKACLGVADAARRLGVPTFAIVGSTGPGAERCLGPDGPIVDAVSLEARYGRERAMREPVALITETVATELPEWEKHCAEGR